jgi:predicted DsbA family dithiol-disulfide isomerase
VYHFHDGRSLNDGAGLAEVAGRALPELPAAAAAAFLGSGEGTEEIARALARVSELGINSIPQFVIDGEIMIGGAAHHGQLEAVFREIEERGEVEKDTTTMFGDIFNY